MARARRRLRLQAALDAAVLVTPVAAAAAIVVPLPLAVAVVAIAGGLAAAWPRDDERIARRLDRDAGLADRMSTALALDRERAACADPVSAGLVQLAITDGVRVAPYADPETAVPLRAPRGSALAIAAVVLAMAIPALITMRGRAPEVAVASLGTSLPPASAAAPKRPALAREDLAYLRRHLVNLRRGGQMPGLALWTGIVDRFLDDAEAGRLDRAELITAIRALPSAGEHQGDLLEAIRRAPAAPPPSEDPPPAVAPPPAPRAFHGASYSEVFVEYTEVIEEVMHAEAVPSTHRWLVHRYFDRIRPQPAP